MRLCGLAHVEPGYVRAPTLGRRDGVLNRGERASVCASGRGMPGRALKRRETGIGNRSAPARPTVTSTGDHSEGTPSGPADHLSPSPSLIPMPSVFRPTRFVLTDGALCTLSYPLLRRQWRRRLDTGSRKDSPGHASSSVSIDSLSAPAYQHQHSGPPAETSGRLCVHYT
jgi:hypothetical protein